MKTIPTLETERLVLRPFGLDDAAEVQRLAGNKAVADTTANIPHPYQDGMAAECISKHRSAFAEGKTVTLALTLKPYGALIGAISLTDISEGHQAELGYWIGKPYWNHGFCTEAGRAVLRYAFTELALLRVHACHMSRNPASGRVVQKLGMVHEGLRRQHAIRWDRCEDLVLYGILKGEWEEAASTGPLR